jgi:hypothetical protein
MPIIVACPKCAANLSAPDDAAGKMVRCPKPGCGAVIPVPAFLAAEEVAVVDAAPAQKPRPVRAREDDDDDDRPRSKRRRQDDDEVDRPRGRRRRRDDDEENDDDFDRPRRRRKSGMGAGTIVALVIGGLVVLVGVGFGIYALVGGGKARVPPGWVEFTSEQDSFKAYFPEKVRSRPGPGHLLIPDVESATEYTVTPKGKTRDLVGVIVLKFDPGLSAERRDYALQSIREQVVERAYSKVSSPRPVKWAGRSAQEFIVEDVRDNPEGRTGGGLIRLLATDTRIYIGLIGSLHGGRLGRDEENGFFDNFEILK